MFFFFFQACARNAFEEEWKVVKRANERVYVGFRKTSLFGLQEDHFIGVVNDTDPVAILFWIDRDLGLGVLDQVPYPGEVSLPPRAGETTRARDEFVAKYKEKVLGAFAEVCMSSPEVPLTDVMKMSGRELLGRQAYA